MNSRLIDNENPKTRAVEFDWTSYYTYDEIYEWLDIQLATYPTILSNFVVGQSFQNRTIRGIRLAHNEVTYPTSKTYAFEFHYCFTLSYELY